MFARLIVFVVLFVATPLWALSGDELEEKTRVIASELRCVVCQNLSVADSPSEMAQQMRAIVRDQLAAGKTPDEVRSYFVSRYGEWVLLAPTPKGFSLLLWVLPFVALVAGLAVAIGLAWHWARRKQKVDDRTVDPALLARVQSEMLSEQAMEPDDSEPRSPLARERARLYADLSELQFDYQAGKLSEEDFHDLRREIELKAARLLEESDRTVVAEPPAVGPEPGAGLNLKTQPEKTQRAVAPSPAHKPIRGWKLATGGAFLLLFGLTLGIALTGSLRPRLSESDSITGDFLTGTSPRRDVQSSLNDGKAAFAQQDWPKAIEAFKRVLTLDPNEPEAHTYMGYILVQAGHAEGALMAFDRALAIAPDLPMALWGKGMTLYQAKQDATGARQTLEKLAALLPPGQERSEVEKALAEISQSASPAPAPSAGAQISGTIRVDPKLQGKVDKQATLFIIARPAGGSGGPPLAVKRIDTPSFPLSYSLGPENVMIQGTPFSGKLLISARLDKDGDAMTRDPGDLSGGSKQPVEVGAKNADIVLDQIAK